MPGWANSNRRDQLPPNWDALRLEVFVRDGHRCTFKYPNGGRCPDKATDCDHIRPGGDHSLANLRSLCSRHHAMKSSTEGAEALHKKKREIYNRFRRSQKDPGFI